MFDLPNVQPRTERRKKPRINLTRALIARFGTPGVILIDASEGGARIEHFTRQGVGRKAHFRFQWEQSAIEAEAVVVWSKVHRFAHGDQGTTVYQSGLCLTEYIADAAATIQKMVTTFIARSLAEQVANARGIGPVTQRSMPVFRSGVVTGGVDPAEIEKQKMIPNTALVVDRGYVRCALIDNRRWDKKWSRTSEQPIEGFTVPATEPDEHIDQLCETYLKADAEARTLIQLMARLSVDKVAQ
jgi:hypothetical protein